MIKFNKVFNSKIISLILACVFLITNIAYGIDLSERSHLRKRLDFNDLNAFPRYLCVLLAATYHNSILKDKLSPERALAKVMEEMGRRNAEERGIKVVAHEGSIRIYHEQDNIDITAYNDGTFGPKKSNRNDLLVEVPARTEQPEPIKLTSDQVSASVVAWPEIAAMINQGNQGSRNIAETLRQRYGHLKFVTLELSVKDILEKEDAKLIVRLDLNNPTVKAIAESEEPILPILVVEKNGKYIVLDGSHRAAAVAKKAGAYKIDALGRPKIDLALLGDEVKIKTYFAVYEEQGIGGKANQSLGVPETPQPVPATEQGKGVTTIKPQTPQLKEDILYTGIPLYNTGKKIEDLIKGIQSRLAWKVPSALDKIISFVRGRILSKKPLREIKEYFGQTRSPFKEEDKQEIIVETRDGKTIKLEDAELSKIEGKTTFITFGVATCSVVIYIAQTPNGLFAYPLHAVIWKNDSRFQKINETIISKFRKKGIERGKIQAIVIPGPVATFKDWNLQEIFGMDCYIIPELLSRIPKTEDRMVRISLDNRKLKTEVWDYMERPWQSRMPRMPSRTNIFNFSIKEGIVTRDASRGGISVSATPSLGAIQSRAPQVSSPAALAKPEPEVKGEGAMVAAVAVPVLESEIAKLANEKHLELLAQEAKIGTVVGTEVAQGRITNFSEIRQRLIADRLGIPFEQMGSWEKANSDKAKVIKERLDEIAKKDDELDAHFKGISSRNVIVDKNTPEFSNLYAETEEIVKRLLKASGLNPDNFSFYLLDSTEENAFVIKYGNRVFVNIGLIKFIVENGGSEDAVAFVLAHEIRHIFQWIDDAIAGKPVERELAESNADEYDSDYALALIDKAGYSVRDAGFFFAKFIEKKGEGGKTSLGFLTHPPTIDRLRKIERDVLKFYWLNFFHKSEHFSDASKKELNNRTKQRLFELKALQANPSFDSVRALRDEAFTEQDYIFLLFAQAKNFRLTADIKKEIKEYFLNRFAADNPVKYKVYELVIDAAINGLSIRQGTGNDFQAIEKEYKKKFEQFSLEELMGLFSIPIILPVMDYRYDEASKSYQEYGAYGFDYEYFIEILSSSTNERLKVLYASGQMGIDEIIELMSLFRQRYIEAEAYDRNVRMGYRANMFLEEMISMCIESLTKNKDRREDIEYLKTIIFYLDVYTDIVGVFHKEMKFITDLCEYLKVTDEPIKQFVADNLFPRLKDNFNYCFLSDEFIEKIRSVEFCDDLPGMGKGVESDIDVLFANLYTAQFMLGKSLINWIEVLSEKYQLQDSIKLFERVMARLSTLPFYKEEEVIEESYNEIFANITDSDKIEDIDKRINELEDIPKDIHPQLRRLIYFYRLGGILPISNKSYVSSMLTHLLGLIKDDADKGEGLPLKRGDARVFYDYLLSKKDEIKQRYPDKTEAEKERRWSRNILPLALYVSFDEKALDLDEYEYENTDPKKDFNFVKKDGKEEMIEIDLGPGKPTRFGKFEGEFNRYEPIDRASGGASWSSGSEWNKKTKVSRGRGINRVFMTGENAESMLNTFSYVVNSDKNFEATLNSILTALPASTYRNFALYVLFVEKFLKEECGVNTDVSRIFELGYIQGIIESLNQPQGVKALETLSRLSSFMVRDAQTEDLNGPTRSILGEPEDAEKQKIISEHASEKSSYYPYEHTELGGPVSQLDIFVGLLAESSILSILKSKEADFKEKIGAILRYFRRESNTRDRFIILLIEDNINALTSEDIEKLYPLLNNKNFKEKYTLLALEKKRAENPEEFSTLDGELKWILYYFSELSATRDDILLQLIDEKANTPPDMQKIRPYLLKAPENIREKKQARVIFGETVFEEYLKRKDAASKAEFLLWGMGITDKKPFFIMRFEHEYNVSLDGMRESYMKRSRGHYKNVGDTAMDEFLEDLFLGENGIFYDEKTTQEFLGVLFETLMPTQNKIMRVLYNAVFRRADMNRKYTIVSALLKNFSKEKGVSEGVNEGQAIRIFLGSLGLVGVKLGQFLSSYDSVPENIRSELKLLKDKAPQLNKDVIFDMIAKVYNGGFEASQLSEVLECIGSASIKVVYRARLKDGRETVIKIKRPEVDKKVEEDLAFLRDILADQQVRDTLRNNNIEIPQQLGNRIAEMIQEEMNLHQEAENQARLRKDISSFRRRLTNIMFNYIASKIFKTPQKKYVFRVPVTYDVQNNTLIIEDLVDGMKLSLIEKYDAYLNGKLSSKDKEEFEKELRELSSAKLETIKRLQKELDGIEAAVARELIKQIFIDGFYHADPHAGNIFVGNEGDAVYFIDVGSASQISVRNRYILFLLMRAVQSGDGMKVLSVINKMSGKDMSGLAQSAGEIATSKENVVKKIIRVFKLLEDSQITVDPELMSIFRCFGQGESLFKAALLGDTNAKPQAQQAQPQGRGYSGLDNSFYTEAIKPKIDQGDFSAVEFKNGKFLLTQLIHEQTGQQLGKDSDRLVAILQSLNLSPEDLKLLEGATILFIDGLDKTIGEVLTNSGRSPPESCYGSHYGISRHQYYLDTERLNNPQELIQHLHHEIQEKNHVVTMMKSIFANWQENRGEDDIESEIAKLANEKHLELLTQEAEIRALDWQTQQESRDKTSLEIAQVYKDNIVNGYVYTGTDEQLLSSIEKYGLTSDPSFNQPVSEEDYQFFKLMTLKSGWQFLLKNYFESSRQTGLFISGDKDTAKRYAETGPERLRIFTRCLGEFLRDSETGKIKESSISQEELHRLREMHLDYSNKLESRRPVMLHIPIRSIIPLLPRSAQEVLNDSSRFQNYITELQKIFHGTIKELAGIFVSEVFKDLSLKGTIKFSPEIIVERLQGHKVAAPGTPEAQQAQKLARIEVIKSNLEVFLASKGVNLDNVTPQELDKLVSLVYDAQVRAAAQAEADITKNDIQSRGINIPGLDKILEEKDARDKEVGGRTLANIGVGGLAAGPEDEIETAVESSKPEEEVIKNSAIEFYNKVIDIINQKTGKVIAKNVPEIIFVDQLTSEESKRLKQLQKRIRYVSREVDRISKESAQNGQKITEEQAEEIIAKHITLEELNEEQRLQEKLKPGTAGGYIASENRIRLNRVEVGSGSTTPYHEMLHAIRTHCRGIAEKHTGYNGLQQDIFKMFQRLRGSDTDTIPAYIAEFFSQLDGIVLKELGLGVNAEEDKQGINLQGLREAARYFKEGFDKRVYEIIESSEKAANLLVEMVGQDKEIKLEDLSKLLTQHISKTDGLVEKMLDYRRYLNLLYPEYPNEALGFDLDGLIQIYNDFIAAVNFINSSEMPEEKASKTAVTRLRNDIEETFIELKDDIAFEKEMIENDIRLWQDISLEFNSFPPYLIAELAIAEHYEEIRNNWPQIFAMDADEVEKKYFEDILKETERQPTPTTEQAEAAVATKSQALASNAAPEAQKPARIEVIKSNLEVFLKSKRVNLDNVAPQELDKLASLIYDAQVRAAAQAKADITRNDIQSRGINIPGLDKILEEKDASDKEVGGRTLANIGMGGLAAGPEDEIEVAAESSKPAAPASVAATQVTREAFLRAFSRLGVGKDASGDKVDWVRRNIESIQEAVQQGKHETGYYPASGRDGLRVSIAYDLKVLITADNDRQLIGKTEEMLHQLENELATTSLNIGVKDVEFNKNGEVTRRDITFKLFGEPKTIVEFYKDVGEVKLISVAGFEDGKVDVLHISGPSGAEKYVDRWLSERNYRLVRIGGFFSFDEGLPWAERYSREDRGYIPTLVYKLFGLEKFDITGRHPETKMLYDVTEEQVSEMVENPHYASIFRKTEEINANDIHGIYSAINFNVSGGSNILITELFKKKNILAEYKASLKLVHERNKEMKKALIADLGNPNPETRDRAWRILTQPDFPITRDERDEIDEIIEEIKKQPALAPNAAAEVVTADARKAEKIKNISSRDLPAFLKQKGVDVDNVDPQELYKLAALIVDAWTRTEVEITKDDIRSINIPGLDKILEETDASDKEVGGHTLANIGMGGLAAEKDDDRIGLNGTIDQENRRIVVIDSTANIRRFIEVLAKATNQRIDAGIKRILDSLEVPESNWQINFGMYRILFDDFYEDEEGNIKIFFKFNDAGDPVKLRDINFLEVKQLFNKVAVLETIGTATDLQEPTGTENDAKNNNTLKPIESMERVRDSQEDVHAVDLTMPAWEGHHVILFKLLLRIIDLNAHELGFKSRDILRGRILNIGLETTFFGHLRNINIVTYLRSQKRNAVGLDPQIAHNPDQGFYKGVVQDMPFSDEEFDIVVSIGLFNEEFFEKIDKQKGNFKNAEEFYSQAAKEIKRVLKPGGRFLVTFGVGPSNIEFLSAFENAGFRVTALQESIGAYVLTKLAKKGVKALKTDNVEKGAKNRISDIMHNLPQRNILSSSI